VKAAALNPEMIVLGLLSGLLTFLPVLAPVGGAVLTTVTPAPLIILAVKYPWWPVLGLIAIEAGVLWLVGELSACFFFGQYAIVALVIAVAVRRRTPLVLTIMGSVLGPLAFGGLLLVGYGAITHQSLPLLFTRYLDQLLNAMQEQIQTVEVRPEGESDALFGMVKALPQLVLTILPAIMVINHLFTNVLSYMLARYYCARSQPSLDFDALQLTHWRVWEYLVWVFLASGTALLLPWAVPSAIGLNVFLVTLAIYFLQGLVIVVFWGQRLPLPPGLRWLLLLLVFIITGPLSVVLCIAAGLFDLWADFRRLRRRPLAP
jgi:hypothetical protein